MLSEPGTEQESNIDFVFSESESEKDNEGMLTFIHCKICHLGKKYHNRELQ